MSLENTKTEPELTQESFPEAIASNDTVASKTEDSTNLPRQLQKSPVDKERNSKSVEDWYYQREGKARYSELEDLSKDSLKNSNSKENSEFNYNSSSELLKNESPLNDSIRISHSDKTYNDYSTTRENRSKHYYTSSYDKEYIKDNPDKFNDFDKYSSSGYRSKHDINPSFISSKDHHSSYNSQESRYSKYDSSSNNYSDRKFTLKGNEHNISTNYKYPERDRNQSRDYQHSKHDSKQQNFHSSYKTSNPDKLCDDYNRLEKSDLFNNLQSNLKCNENNQNKNLPNSDPSSDNITPSKQASSSVIDSTATSLRRIPCNDNEVEEGEINCFDDEIADNSQNPSFTSEIATPDKNSSFKIPLPETARNDLSKSDDISKYGFEYDSNERVSYKSTDGYSYSKYYGSDKQNMADYSLSTRSENYTPSKNLSDKDSYNYRKNQLNPLTGSRNSDSFSSMRKPVALTEDRSDNNKSDIASIRSRDDDFMTPSENRRSFSRSSKPDKYSESEKSRYDYNSHHKYSSYDTYSSYKDNLKCDYDYDYDRSYRSYSSKKSDLDYTSDRNYHRIQAYNYNDTYKKRKSNPEYPDSYSKNVDKIHESTSENSSFQPLENTNASLDRMDSSKSISQIDQLLDDKTKGQGLTPSNNNNHDDVTRHDPLNPAKNLALDPLLSASDTKVLVNSQNRDLYPNDNGSVEKKLSKEILSNDISRIDDDQSSLKDYSYSKQEHRYRDYSPSKYSDSRSSSRREYQRSSYGNYPYEKDSELYSKDSYRVTSNSANSDYKSGRSFASTGHDLAYSKDRYSDEKYAKPYDISPRNYYKNQYPTSGEPDRTSYPNSSYKNYEDGVYRRRRGADYDRDYALDRSSERYRSGRPRQRESLTELYREKERIRDRERNRDSGRSVHRHSRDMNRDRAESRSNASDFTEYDRSGYYSRSNRYERSYTNESYSSSYYKRAESINRSPNTESINIGFKLDKKRVRSPSPLDFFEKSNYESIFSNSKAELNNPPTNVQNMTTLKPQNNPDTSLLNKSPIHTLSQNMKV
ncbi:hypothetical protein AYI70_g11752, partial [Smittium culicis]